MYQYKIWTVWRATRAVYTRHWRVAITYPIRTQHTCHICTRPVRLPPPSSAGPSHLIYAYICGYFYRGVRTKSSVFDVCLTLKATNGTGQTKSIIIQTIFPTLSYIIPRFGALVIVGKRVGSEPLTSCHFKCKTKTNKPVKYNGRVWALSSQYIILIRPQQLSNWLEYVNFLF